MNPSEKLIIMALIYLVSGQEAHDMPVYLKNMLGRGNEHAKKQYLLDLLQKRLMELDDYEKYIADSWKGEAHESAV